MSTNTALEDIKARAAGAAEARLKLIDAEDESQEETLSISAAFIAEQSSYDVPKLLAALEAVEALAKGWQETPKRPTTFDAALHHASIKLQTAITDALA